MATYLGNRRTLCVLSGSSTPIASNDLRFSVNFYLESQNVANNTSYIRADLILEKWGGNAYGQTTGTITIDGVAQNKQIANVYLNYPAGTHSLGSLYWTVNHATDGTKTLTASGTIRTNPDYDGFMTRSFTFSVGLPKIARGTTINSFTFAKVSGAAGLSGLRATWATAHSIDRIQYSLSGGSYTTVTGSGTSGSFNISGLTPNKQYSLKIKVKRSDSQVETESGTLYATTYDYARITTAPSNNVNMDNNQTLTYTNPSGASLDIGVYTTDGNTPIAPYRTCSGTSYTFAFTNEEKAAFYNRIPATKTLPLRFYLRTSDGLGNSYGSVVERTFEVFNANPTFTTWTYEDINPLTLDLTGDNQKIIKGFSNVKATITSDNKMVAIKGATPTRYQLTIGTKPSATVNYSSNSTVEMTLNTVDNNVFNCYAIDSRGNATNVTKTITTDYINYVPILITKATATRTGGTGTETTLKFNGNFWNSSFGTTTNSIKSVTYMFKKTTDEEYTVGTSEIVPIKTDGEFSFSGIIKGDDGVDGFDALHSYDIHIVITDALSTTAYDLVLGSGTPNIAIHQDGVAINRPYDETLGGALQITGNIFFNIDGELVPLLVEDD